MLVYLVFEHNWEGLDFRGIYDNFNAAVNHARTIHQSAAAEVHKVSIKDKFVIDELRPIGVDIVWSTFDQSGAI